MRLDPLIKKVAWFAAAYLFVAAAVALYIAMTGSFAGRGTGLDPETVARGQAHYVAHCARCHGANLEGQPGWETRRADGTIPAPPQDETGHTWQHPDRQIFDYIKLGGGIFSKRGERSEMPGYADQLSDPEIWALIAFIKSRWPDEVRARQLRANMLGGFEHH
ncbi:MAG: cytochrome [Rhodospirillales bacterium]|jgi:mono/diheme cytochrome c family protein|nr:cytochrome [Rhodospirillales bacterium]